MSEYRLVSYRADDGSRAGLLLGTQIYDLNDELTRAGVRSPGSSLRAILSEWPILQTHVVAIAENGTGSAGRPLAEVTLAAPLPDAGMVWCAAANYYDHFREMSGRDAQRAELEPFFFLKAGGPAAIVGDGEPVRLPAFSERIDWEAEVAVVIGRAARRVKAKDAMEYVAGYTILNDLSARDWMIRDDWHFRFDWVRQKCFDTSCPMGPWITPALAVGDPQNLKIDLWIGGCHEQDTNTNRMIFSIAEQIEALSLRQTLMPGDVIATGTGAGCGHPKRKYLKAGDTMTITIEKLGTLRNPVVRE